MTDSENIFSSKIGQPLVTQTTPSPGKFTSVNNSNTFVYIITLILTGKQSKSN